MSRSDRISLAAAGAAVVLAVAAAWVALAPTDGDDAPDDAATLLIAAPSRGAVPSTPPAAATLVVDVQGAVARPGVRQLPAGSRIADAIAAAGGYGPDADLAAASTAVNLAQALVDGQQVRVPRVGEAVPAAAPSQVAGTGSAGGGLVNLNTATPEELEALPGIGPVTVQKIVAARTERPFASLEDAVERGVLNRGQLDEIRDAATAG